MKKILCTAIAASLALTVFGASTVSAAATGDQVVLKGTPTIDAVVDDIYKSSLTIEYNGDKNAMETDWDGATLKGYALYDTSYLYLVADVKDDDVVELSDTYILSTANPYEGDVVEFRLDLNGSDDQADHVKIGIEANGKIVYVVFNKAAIDVSKVISATKLTADGYTVELAVPIGIDEHNALIEAGELGFKIWFHDLRPSGANKATPVMNEDYVQYGEIIGTEALGDRVYYKLSKETAKAPTAATTTPAAPTTTPAAPTTTPVVTPDAPVAGAPTAPSTFDPAIIAVALTAASGAAFVFASKKH